MSKIMNDVNQQIKNSFRNYLMKRYRLRRSTANGYISAINRLSKVLNLNGSIYDIRKVSGLESIKEGLFTNNKFNSLDRSDRCLFSNSLKRYYEFAVIHSQREVNEK